MKIVIILLLGVGLGFAIGRFSSPTSTLASPMGYGTWAQSGIKKVEDFPNAQAQLAEAERYYGKAVVLFLATLYNRTQTHLASQTVGHAVEEKLEQLEASSPKELTSSTPSQVLPSKEIIKEEKTKTKFNTKEEDLKRLMAYRSSKSANKMTPEVRKMIGSFEGVFVQEFGKNKGRVDRVEIDLMFDMNEGKLQGQTRIVLINPQGQIYSNSSGDGSNQTLKLIEGTKDQIYIETAPGEFIIMDVSRPNQLTGKYYDPGGTYRGSIQLSRK
jgi:hypothetical protein